MSIFAEMIEIKSSYDNLDITFFGDITAKHDDLLQNCPTCRFGNFSNGTLPVRMFLKPWSLCFITV